MISEGSSGRALQALICNSCTRGRRGLGNLTSRKTTLSRNLRRVQDQIDALVGGGTAVLAGWRSSTIDAHLYSDEDEVFHDIQAIKERLQLNIEFARPEDFVPPLEGAEDRHVFSETVRRVGFFHYDPYSQLLSKVVRGFRRDLLDAKSFVDSGMVDISGFRDLVSGIPDAAYARYPALSREAVQEAVDAFLEELSS